MQTQKLVHDNNFKDVLMTERALNCMPDKKIVANSGKFSYSMRHMLHTTPIP